MALERAREVWLQTQYPALLARRCIDFVRRLSKDDKAGFDDGIFAHLKAHTFERQLFINDLWIADKSLTHEWSTVSPFCGGPLRQVRCGLPFQELLDKEAPKNALGYDAVDTLYRLFSATVISPRQVFAGARHPKMLLHINEYILEKTFVYGILALSKWLGKERFPCGIFG